MANRYDEFHKNLDIPNIISVFKEVGSLRGSSKIIGISPTAIKRVLKLNNISYKSAIEHTKKYTYNENYFETVDTPDKAYFLGWMYSDGCINLKNGRLCLAIQEEDIKILNLFKLYTQSNSKVFITNNKKSNKYKNQKNTASFYIFSRKIANDLSKLGCVEKKSLILKFPTEDQVPNHLLSHFLRGYFEGDGSIHLNIKTKKNIFTVLGTNEFLNGFIENLVTNLGIKVSNIRDNKNNSKVKCFSYGSLFEIAKIYKYLYKDCGDLYLTRKKEKLEYISNRKYERIPSKFSNIYKSQNIRHY